MAQAFHNTQHYFEIVAANMVCQIMLSELFQKLRRWLSRYSVRNISIKSQIQISRIYLKSQDPSTPTGENGRETIEFPEAHESPKRVEVEA